MARCILTESRLRAGRWEATLATDGAAPAVAVTHLGTALGGIEVTAAGPGRWSVSVAIPAELLSDGVHSFLMLESDGGERLASLSIIAGTPLDGDLRAEIDLLRAELDLLKQAFRRHAAARDG